ncbi:restriction endonuclease-like protein [Mariniblastus sp.]|nr:restriction endonuclease-like protein [Mariniblastus sp.]
MPELVSKRTTDFELSIWCNSIETSQSQLYRTLSRREGEVPASVIYFEPAVLCHDAGEGSPFTELQLAAPVFFENKSYDVEIVFPGRLSAQFGISHPKVRHRLRVVEESFRYNPKTRSLRATINTGNDIGWFSFDILYSVDNDLVSQRVAFEVLPVKMDMNGDVESINRDIDAEYPLWRFSLAQKTQQHFQADRRQRQTFLLLWLAQFEKLRLDMEKGLKRIVNAPHSRLLDYSLSVKMEKLKGKMSPMLQMRIRESMNAGVSNKRFTLNKKRLSLDTPENRFIKFVINSSIEKIARIMSLASGNENRPENQRLSNSFFDNLKSWSNSLIHTRNHRLFQEVGSFSGMTSESLVLQQKPGYAKVYKAWQQLKWFLDLLGNDSSLSVRNVAELYEVWCFLQVRNVIIELGFREISNNKPVLVNRGVDVAMKDGMAGAFHFHRGDGIHIRLAHEPIFREGTKPVRTWMTTQIPDIVLRAEFQDGSEIYWIFDAKYRIDAMASSDLVPDDAINQMHRYRDALIYQHKSDSSYSDKSRPVFGAYVLYPGSYDQYNQPNPYQEAIEEVGIGAFSLLPSSDNSGRQWLRKFLESKLGGFLSKYSETKAEKFYIENAVRIPYKGTRVTHYNDLTAVFSGSTLDRSEDYIERLATGKLAGYHTRLLATERQSIEEHIVKELRYIAIALSDDGLIESAKFVYPVKAVQLVKRGTLTIEQTGVDKFDDPNQDYWYFILGKAIKQSNPLPHPVPAHFEVHLTNYDDLTSTKDWTALPKCYTVLTG